LLTQLITVSKHCNIMAHMFSKEIRSILQVNWLSSIKLI